MTVFFVAGHPMGITDVDQINFIWKNDTYLCYYHISVVDLTLRIAVMAHNHCSWKNDTYYCC